MAGWRNLTEDILVANWKKTIDMVILTIIFVLWSYYVTKLFHDCSLLKEFKLYEPLETTTSIDFIPRSNRFTFPIKEPHILLRTRWDLSVNIPKPACCILAYSHYCSMAYFNSHYFSIAYSHYCSVLLKCKNIPSILYSKLLWASYFFLWSKREVEPTNGLSKGERTNSMLTRFITVGLKI